MPDKADQTVLLEGDASGATAVGITVEPDGGSKKPTSAPIAMFELEADERAASRSWGVAWPAWWPPTSPRAPRT